MATKRKVPLTKAGKPDKRYVKSVGAKSKATGKAPTKRTQKRRAKPQIKGYSSNPVAKKNPVNYAVWVSEYGKRWYFVSEKNSVSSGYVDDDIKNASIFSKCGAEKIAKSLGNQLNKNTGIVAVKK